MEKKLDNYLWAHRHCLGLRQDDIGFLLDIDKASVSHYEHSERHPNLERGLAYRAILGEPLPNLFVGLNEKVEHKVRKRAHQLIKRVAQEEDDPEKTPATESAQGNCRREGWRARNKCMQRAQRRGKRVLAIFPNWRGFGFAMFNGSARLLRYGVKDIRTDQNGNSVREVEELINEYDPQVLILRECELRQCARIRRLTKSLTLLGKKNDLEVHAYSRAEIWQCFSKHGHVTKQCVASVIAEQFPQLKRMLPTLEKKYWWDNERHHMGLFDAVALGRTYFDGE